MESIRTPDAGKELEQVLRVSLKTELRPYQSAGVAWLNILNQMQLGAILADDMGLGKTIQVLSLLLLRQSGNKGNPALLIVPASLIGNWKSEIDRFASSLKYWIAHPSGNGMDEPAHLDADVLITTYGAVARMAWLLDRDWSIIIADEAQAIKNPSAKQTKAIKRLKSKHRIVLTGTPVENHLSDLWSLFDFVSPGLLGSTKDFEGFLKRAGRNGESPYAVLRALVRPYILRRMKTDKNVISDLPDKTEVKTFCPLSRKQAVLYQASVESLAGEIKHADGIKRRGIVRLPRGRAYARNGSIIHLNVDCGKIDALVQGSSLYKVSIEVKQLEPKKWNMIVRNCSGQIDSVIELLQGRLSSGVMKTIIDKNHGLFPAPREISLHCSCPDWADMCKHVAAVLYGVGNRLDQEPELLFKLRKVDHMALMNSAHLRAPQAGAAKSRILKDENLSEIFGIDIAGHSAGLPRASRGARNKGAKKLKRTKRVIGK